MPRVISAECLLRFGGGRLGGLVMRYWSRLYADQRQVINLVQRALLAVDALGDGLNHRLRRRFMGEAVEFLAVTGRRHACSKPSE